MSTKNTIKHLISASIAAGALLAATPDAHAAVPQTITHQGRLYDSNKMPVTGTLDVTFKIYAVKGDTDPIWEETHQITFDEGYFSATLGDINPFSSAMVPVFDGSTRFMGVTVGTDPEMTPRAVIQSVPYAMVAGDVFGDIHPTSISVGGTEIINNMGEWTGSATGLVGPPGATGPTGPVGPTGPQGAKGDKGDVGVVSTHTVTGPIAAVPPGGGGAPWTFIGPTTSVPLQPNQRITGSAVGVVGPANGSSLSVLVSVNLCIRTAGSATIDAFYPLNDTDMTVHVNPIKTMVSAAGSFAPNVPVGGQNYDVGLCIRNKSINIQLSNNDQANGWFIVTN